MKDYAERFYKSDLWVKTREGFIKERTMIDGGMCERCHQRLGFIVHHKEHISPENINDPEVTLNFENLEYLCKLCHNKEHKDEMHKREKPSCIFNSDGQPIDTRII